MGKPGYYHVAQLESELSVMRFVVCVNIFASFLMDIGISTLPAGIFNSTTLLSTL